jgi:hypothetical protein
MKKTSLQSMCIFTEVNLLWLDVDGLMLQELGAMTSKHTLNRPRK